MNDPMLDTIHAVGYIAQVRLREDGKTWVSWTQYSKGSPGENRDNALTHVRRLLENKPDMFDRGRVVRADWVVEQEIVPDATDPQAAAPQENGGT